MPLEPDMSNYEDHHMNRRWKQDQRPAYNGWAPGDDLCKCVGCGSMYIGAKWTDVCADCAYPNIHQTPTPDPREKWDRRFLELASNIAQWSKDPSTKVGAVIVRPDRTIASLGYNGFTRGFTDDLELLSNREAKYQFIVHAEANAIVSARESLHGFTLYTTPLPVCVDCCKLTVQAGITRFVSYIPTSAQRERWLDSFRAAERIILECKLEQTLYQSN